MGLLSLDQVYDDIRDFLDVDQFSTSPYRAGNTSRVNTVLETNPPITTVASGLCTSAPVPEAIAIGTKPRDATKAVINTGLSLVIAPLRMASSIPTPSSRSLFMNVIITSPFRTATPESAMNPTAAEIEKGISLSHRPANPPVKARGTPCENH